jgi:hypothetical protein
MHKYALVQLGWITDVDIRRCYFGGGLCSRIDRVRVLMVCRVGLLGCGCGVIYVGKTSLSEA